MHSNDTQSPLPSQRTLPDQAEARPQPFRTSRGRSTPLGATPFAEGVNFVLMCRHGTSVRLVLQDLDSDRVIAEIPLDAHKHRTGDLWHIHLYDPPKAFRYGWRVDGPPGRRHRF